MLRCNHCGECCINPNLEISITLFDIARISRLLNKKPSQLNAEGKIRIALFSSNNCYEVGFGLADTCKFYRHEELPNSCSINKCTIYDKRPLNCRLFPQWILAQSKSMPQLINDELYCMQEIDDDVSAYKIYVKEIGDRLVKESEYTEKFLENMGYPKTIEGENPQLLLSLLPPIWTRVDLEVEKIRDEL